MGNSAGAPAEMTVFTVDKLIKYMGDDGAGRAIIAKIVRDAIAPGDAPLAVAALAVREQRYAEAGHVLHGLRGSIGSLGCQRFVHASLAAELAMSEQRWADVPALFAEVETQYGLVLKHAAAWLKDNDVPA